MSCFEIHPPVNGAHRLTHAVGGKSGIAGPMVALRPDGYNFLPGACDRARGARNRSWPQGSGSELPKRVDDGAESEVAA
jgi:hypothetical protein